jgi:predicted RNA-binding Zn-ribbon protein involved in translation (DUF1610 family)
MAVVIHTRKGKYQYAYEHTREGDKVISRYMYPVNDRGDKIKQYRGKVAQQSKEKEVAQQTNIDTEIEEMEVYAALHTKKVRKKHTFKKCPICGSTNIRIIDLRPLGHKNSSQCRECGHTL